MSDDLVKRLRATCSCNIDNTPCLAEEECRVAQEAADRIEELENACKEWADVSQSNYQRAKAAEAFSEQLEDMLTVAIVALKKIAACDEGNVVKYIQTVDALALDALDALKGKLA